MDGHVVEEDALHLRVLHAVHLRHAITGLNASMTERRKTVKPTSSAFCSRCSASLRDIMPSAANACFPRLSCAKLTGAALQYAPQLSVWSAA